MTLKEYANSIARELRSFGLTVWIAERGTYGIFSDHAGERVISWQVNDGLKFSGNYTPSRISGTGWRIGEVFPRDRVAALEMLYTLAPRWANEAPHYTTVEKYLDVYKSSRFVKVA